MYLSIIDFSFIYYKSLSIIKYYYNKEFTFQNLEDRGYLVRKVTTDLCKIVTELNSDNTVFCFDSSSFRYSLSPTYKEGRGEKEEGFREVEDELYELYKSLGINVCRIEGLEADDVMALISTSPKYEKYIKIIVTGDEDLRQLIEPKTFVYNPDSKKRTFYYGYDSQVKYKPKESDTYFYERVEPFFILMSKLTRGCSSDKINPIVPKGYRSVKIRKMYESLLDDSTSESIEDALFKALNSQDIIVDRELMDNQLKMVYLHPNHMPSSSVNLFNDTFKLQECDFEFDMKKILADTKYIDKDYKK